ncbi:hypothetical protein CO612_07690 [Lysobacteraceae bacterium NML71-0210]|nr:hypothetical protein CO612_07690 [Xanthomonadaceae bacterium NML71-0210]
MIDKVVHTLINPKRVWDMYRALTESTEMGSRISLARNRMIAGGSKLEAAFEAKDFLDFGLHGDGVLLQWAIRTLPFLNARLQGNYRLFRMATGKERRKMVAARLASIALFTAVLYFWNMTEYEEEWENLNDWDKDMYWHIKPGTRFHIRIPKPFEIGLFAGTAVERSLAALMYQASDGKRGDHPKQTFKAAGRGASDTLALNPVPQAAKPLFEQSVNYNIFMGRNIESAFEQHKVPSERKTPRSSETAILLSKAMAGDDGDGGISPKRIEHLVRGYFGSMGMYVLRTADALVRAATDAFAIVTKDGKQVQLRGGYFPLKFEYDSADGKRDEMGEVWDALRAGRFASASTRDNHTKERVGSGGRTVRLDFGVIHSHLLDVNRDLHLGDEVNYVHSVLNGKAFKQAVSDTGNAELLKGLDVWLRDVAIGEMALRQYSESWARAFRTNFTAAVLTWKPTTALIQITGVTQSAAVLGSDYVLHGLKSFLSQPGAMLEYAASHSSFMAARAKKHVEAVEQVRNAFDGRFKVLRNAMIRNGYRMIAWVQRLVDTVTWLAAEKKGMALFDGDVVRARQYADNIVARAQGSGEWMDKNALQRGSFGDRVRQTEWIAATTALQSYLMAKASIAYEKVDQLVRDVDGFNAKSLAAAMQYSMDMLLLFAVEGIVMAALMGKLPSDEDDDDGLLDDWAKFVFSDAGGQLLGGIPGLGALVRAAKGFDSQGVVASMWESAADTGKQIGQGEADKALAKSVVKMAGFWTGIPSSQINKTIDAIAAEADGKDVSPFDYIRGVPKEKDRTVSDYLNGEAE